ncbi:MAG TPA: hypothetical protein G4O17_05460 [Dehalococcoidia bacterium]|nr:hypothetical protein [Dehalococcoidia bacterium]
MTIEEESNSRNPSSCFGAYFEGYIGDDFIWGDSNLIYVDVEDFVDSSLPSR